MIDEKEVEMLLRRYGLWAVVSDECIKDICKLQSKNQITKEKIIEILESPLGKNYKAEENLTLLKKLREQIASEILGNKEKQGIKNEMYDVS